MGVYIPAALSSWIKLKDLRFDTLKEIGASTKQSLKKASAVEYLRRLSRAGHQPNSKQVSVYLLLQLPTINLIYWFVYEDLDCGIPPEKRAVFIKTKILLLSLKGLKLSLSNPPEPARIHVAGVQDFNLNPSAVGIFLLLSALAVRTQDATVLA